MHILNIGRGRIQARQIIRRSSRKHGHKGHHHKQPARERGGWAPQATSDGGGRGEGGTTTAIRKDRGIDESEEEEEEEDEEFKETKAVQKQQKDQSKH